MSRSQAAPESRVRTGMIVLRAGWGIALLVFPQAVLGDLPHGRIDGSARAFARTLGARQLVQVALLGRAGKAPAFVGAAVDSVHAATMGLLAWRRPDRRALALTNVATATALAAAGVIEGLQT